MFAHSLYAIEAGIDPQDFFYFQAGVAAYELGEFEKAIPLLHASIQLNPNHVESFHYLGLSLQALNKEDIAQQAFERENFLRNVNPELNNHEDEFDIQIF